MKTENNNSPSKENMKKTMEDLFNLCHFNYTIPDMYINQFKNTRRFVSKNRKHCE